ncbi:hypothetical protein [Arenimonas sp.]
MGHFTETVNTFVTTFSLRWRAAIVCRDEKIAALGRRSNDLAE